MNNQIALLIPLLLVANAGAAEPAPAAKAPEKIGWVDTVEKQMQGWTVVVDTKLAEAAPDSPGARALSMLDNHLERISILLPADKLAEVRKLKIFIQESHPEMKTMGYHPGVEWLTDRGYDPRLAKTVHIPRAEALISREQMLKHPAVILHELAHSYHDQVLGFEDPSIMKAYEQAIEKGIYQKSLLYNGGTVKHYGATNHKEYFAESTEAYFYHNDFYPFTRAELRLHDPAGFALMEKVWGKID
ncbi:MAG: metallopeptidase [Verrucomicrobiales bacterium]